MFGGWRWPDKSLGLADHQAPVQRGAVFPDSLIICSTVIGTLNGLVAPFWASAKVLANYNGWFSPTE
jgi:hypothetical protein